MLEMKWEPSDNKLRLTQHSSNGYTAKSIKQLIEQTNFLEFSIHKYSESATLQYTKKLFPLNFCVYLILYWMFFRSFSQKKEDRWLVEAPAAWS